MQEMKTQWCGLNMRGDLKIYARSVAKLVGKLENVEQAHLNRTLPKNWWQDEPAYDLMYEPLPLEAEYFEVNLEKDAVVGLIVDKNIRTSELNIIKAVVSQLQVDLAAVNEIKSSRNEMLEDGNQASYKVMEPTVNGDCETVYDISVNPGYLHQQKSQRSLSKNDKNYEVVKTKNFDNCRELPVYAVSGGRLDIQLIKDALEKSSETRMMLEGTSPDNFTIWATNTLDRIVIRPSKHVRDELTVISKVILKLQKKETARGSEYPSVKSAVEVESLVYTPYESEVASEQLAERLSTKYNKIEAEKNGSARPRRSLYSESEEDEEMNSNKKSKFVQFERTSINDLNAIEKARRLTQDISDELERPTQLHKDGTLNKFLILSKIIRVQLNERQIIDLYREYASEPKQNAEIKRNIFRDAIADAGSEAAVSALIKLVADGELKDEEAAQVIAILPKTIRTFDDDLQKKFYVSFNASGFPNWFRTNLVSGICNKRESARTGQRQRNCAALIDSVDEQALQHL